MRQVVTLSGTCKMHGQARSRSSRTAIFLASIWLVYLESAAAQTNVTWQGGSGTTYGTAANWNPAVVPFNNATDTYNVFIPASQTVVMNVDGNHTITDLTLAAGANLSIAPGESLTVLDDATISGNISTAGGTFAAVGLGAQFEGSGFRLAVSGSGTISVNATGYTNILSDFRADSTLLSADQGSTLNLSNVTTFSMQDSYGHSGSWNYYVTAKNNSTIDLSKVTSVVGAGQDEHLRFRTETGGNINLAALKTATGRTWFDIDSDLALPALETTASARLSLGNGRTLNAPELITWDGSNIYATGWSEPFTLGTGATLNAPKLKNLQNVALTWAPGRTFNHALTNIDGSEIAVVEGGNLNLSGVTSYTNILSDFRADSTLLSADQGSTLNLSNVTTFSMQDSYGHSGSWNYYVTAKNNSTIDLSKVTSVVGAGQDEHLRFRTETGGNINLAALKTATGRTWFDIDSDLALPALETTASARLSLGNGRTLNAPELITWDGSNIYATGWSEPFTLGTGATLNAPKLKNLQNVALTWAPGSDLQSRADEH